MKQQESFEFSFSNEEMEKFIIVNDKTLREIRGFLYACHHEA